MNKCQEVFRLFEELGNYLIFSVISLISHLVYHLSTQSEDLNSMNVGEEVLTQDCFKKF